MIRCEIVSQISLFAENKPGRMYKVFETLAGADVEVLAFTIAEAGTFGVFHMIVDKPDEAYDALSKAGFTVSRTQILGTELESVHGSLYWISKRLAENDVSVDYAYTSMSKNKNLYLVMRVSDSEKAKRVLENSTA
ncbi:MAG: acetolactate synthase [Methermicoccaceae archaeon]